MSSPRGIFKGYVSEDGNVSFDFPSEAYAFNREYFADHEVEIEIRKRRSKRSLDQNAAYHASIGPLAEHLGYTTEELKLAMLGGCFGWREVAGMSIPIELHTSGLNTEQFSDLMAYTQRIAAEHGVLILDPSEWKAAKRKEVRRSAAGNSRRLPAAVHGRGRGSDRDRAQRSAAPGGGR